MQVGEAALGELDEQVGEIIHGRARLKAEMGGHGNRRRPATKPLGQVENVPSVIDQDATAGSCRETPSLTPDVAAAGTCRPAA